MKRDFLRELGIEGDVVDKIMSEYGKNVNSLKADIEEKEKNEAEFEATKAQLEDMQKQLKDFEGNSETIEELKDKLKKQAEEYETFKLDTVNRETTRSKMDAVVKALKVNGAIDDGLDLLASSIDLGTVQLTKSGDIVDLDDIINPLKEKRKGLFSTTELGGEKPPIGGEGKPDADNMTDQEYFNSVMKK